MQPVVLCFDDVHWADPSTTDLIGYLARRIDATRLLIVGDLPAVGPGAGAPSVPAAEARSDRARHVPRDPPGRST